MKGTLRLSLGNDSNFLALGLPFSADFLLENPST